VVRILVTGARGQLGSDLMALLPGASGFDLDLDVRDRAAVGRAVAELKPELVYNCAADNAVDRAEADPESARAVNALGARNVAEACADAGARLVHFSTNYVFAGDLDRPYVEGDEPGPLGAYARSKLEGERLVLDALAGALVVRTAGLFGVRGAAVKGGSFPERILARARGGEKLRVVADQRLNPTFTGHLAEAVIGYVEQGRSGILHAVAAGCCSYSELATETLRLAGMQAEVEDLNTSELGSSAPRPLNGCLLSVHVAPLPPWREGLAEWWRRGDGTARTR
jgi:dTDP-4-dehydrorhamnose reductase